MRRAVADMDANERGVACIGRARIDAVARNDRVIKVEGGSRINTRPTTSGRQQIMNIVSDNIDLTTRLNEDATEEGVLCLRLVDVVARNHPIDFFRNVDGVA